MAMLLCLAYIRTVKPIILEKSVSSSVSIESLFAYFSDFCTTAEWDPNTLSTTLISGDGTLGSEYLNISTFNGRESSLIYRVIDFVPNQRIVLRGENSSITAIDTMQIVPGVRGENGAIENTFIYRAEFTLKGLGKFAAPFLKSAFQKLGETAEAGMRDAIKKLH
jgi:uncharacterized protein YndB with AHSA1/START domain